MEIDEHLEKTAGAVPFSWVIERREFYRDALLNRPIKIETEIDFDDDDSWDNACLWRDLPLDLVFQQPMKALVYCKDVEAALRATVFLDRLKGLRWRACAREDCNKPFELPPRRAKMFCSPECAHLQSVRNYNKRKRSPKAEKAIKSVKKKVRG